MIKTTYEYLFIVLSDKIAMVRKEANGFSVVPVSDGGGVLSSFEDPTQYWTDWVALTNFSIRHSEVDFAFLADKKDCRFAAADAKKPEQLKVAEQTTWTKQTVLAALKMAGEAIGLPMAVSVQENGNQLFDLKVGDPGEPLLLHLTRFGVVKDEKDELETVPIVQKDPVDQKSSPGEGNAATAGETVMELSDQQQSTKSVTVRSPEIIADSCYNDETALALAVGDRITGVVDVITRFGVYVRASGIKEQLKIKPSSDVLSLKVGDKVSLEVISVDGNQGRTLFGCEL